MKKLLIMILLAFAMPTVYAQKLDAAKVPTEVKAGFAKQFPKATDVKWEKENGLYEAGFKDVGQKKSATFDAKGTMTESEVSIKVSELPMAATEYIKAHYKGLPVKEAAKITKANGEVNYEAEISKMDVIFDAKGTFIKEAKD